MWVCPAISYFNVIMQLDQLKCLHMMRVANGKPGNSSSVFWQLRQTTGKHVVLSEAGYFQQKLAPKYIFLQTDLFLQDNLKSNLLFRKICSMFPFEGCSFTVWLACAVQQNSLPWSSKKLENKKRKYQYPPAASVYFRISLCISNLWRFSNWFTPRSCYSKWYFWTFHCYRIAGGFSPPACWYMDLLCVVSDFFSLLTPTLSFRPESPVLCVSFCTISPSVWLSPFPQQFAYCTFMNFFNVFRICCVFFCFSLI